MTRIDDAYNIVITRPSGYAHSSAFSEIAETLQSGFADLGCDAMINENRIASNMRNIVLGANLLPITAVNELPADTIIYNFEQLFDGSPWVSPTLRFFLTNYQVWDYNEKNVEFLRRLGGQHEPIHVPLGYANPLTRIDVAEHQDIDVLYYGCLNERRAEVLHKLREAGLNVVHLFGVYGVERDKHISRAKVVINIHHYESQLFEIARVSYLLANKKAVVSECGESTDIPVELKCVLEHAPYGNLVDACTKLVYDIACPV